MLYILIIVIMMALIAIANIIFNPMYDWYVYVVAVVIFTISSILLDGVVALIIRKMNEKYFDYHKKIFNASPKRIRFYDSLGIKKWKDKVLELGMFTNFRKNKIDNPKDPMYIRQYILEACYGVIIHYVSIPASFLILLLDYNMYIGESNLFLTVALPVALVNVVLIGAPALVLRYNLVKLIKIYEIQIRKNKD